MELHKDNIKYHNSKLYENKYGIKDNWFEEGMYENKFSSVLPFCAESYKNRYDDLKFNKKSKKKSFLINHWKKHGFPEGRIGSKLIKKKNVGLIYVYYERKNEQKNQSNLSYFIKYGLNKNLWKDIDLTVLFIINGYKCEVNIPNEENFYILKQDNSSDWEGWKDGINYFEKKFKKKIYEIFNYLCLMNAGCIGPIYDNDKTLHWLDPFFNKMKKDNSILCCPCSNILNEKDLGGPGIRVVPIMTLIKINKEIINLLMNVKIYSYANGKLGGYYNTILGKKKSKEDAILTGEYGLSRILMDYGLSSLIKGTKTKKIDRFNTNNTLLLKSVFIKNNWIIEKNNNRDSKAVLYDDCINFLFKKLKLKNIFYNFDNYNYDLVDVNDKGNIYNNNTKLSWTNKKEFYELCGRSEEHIMWPNIKNDNKSVVIYAHYDKNNLIKDYVIQSLKTYMIIGYDIIFCTTSSKIINVNLPFKIYYFKNKNNIKAGNDIFMWNNILQSKILIKYEWILLTNDSILLPIHGIENMEKSIKSQRNKSDFWGLYESNEKQIHLCSCFVEFNQSSIEKIKTFYKKNLININSTEEIIDKIEIKQTDFLVRNNLKYSSLVSYKNLENLPCPLFNPTNVNKYINNINVFGIKWKYCLKYLNLDKINNPKLNYLLRYLYLNSKRIEDYVYNHFD